MIGKTFGRFRIDTKLGEGGMGSVWRAEDSLLGRTVAIKLLPEGLTEDTEANERFLREARAASTLQHTGIATVYDAGQSNDHTFIAMEFVDGEAVAERIHRGPMSVGDAVDIAVQVTEALAYAHMKDVLHRDVTGRNVMIDRAGRAVLVDFGLALSKGATRVTEAGTMVGTAGYVAPEIIRGEEASPASDVYSVGVLLYEMLVGQPPFRGERAEAVLFAAIHEEPPSPAEFRRDLPQEADDIVLRALAKHPKDRFRTAAEMTRALRAVVLPDDEKTVPLPVRTPVLRFGRQLSEKLRAALLRRRLAATVLILAALAVLVWQRWAPSTAPSFTTVAVLPFTNMSQETAESEFLVAGLSEALITKLTKIRTLRVTPWATVQRYEGSDLSVDQIAAELRVEGVVVGTFRHLGERISGTVSLVDAKTGFQGWTEEFNEPIENMLQLESAVAVATANQIRGTLTGEELEGLERPLAEDVEAYEFYLKGSGFLRGGSKEASDIALAFFNRALEIDPDYPEAHVGVGAVHSDRYFRGWGGRRDLVTAESHYRVALELRPGFGAARRGLIRVLWETGHSEEILKIGRIAEAHDASDLEQMLVRAEAYLFSGLQEKAVPLLDQAIDIDPRNQNAHWLHVVASHWSGLGEQTVESGRVYLSTFGEDGEMRMWIAAAYDDAGQHESAADQYARAIEVFGDNPTDYVHYYASAAFERSGESEIARELLGESEAILEERLGLFPSNSRIRGMLGMTKAALGKGTEAEGHVSVLLQDSASYDDLGALTIAAIVTANLGDFKRAVTILQSTEPPVQADLHPVFAQLLRLEEFYASEAFRGIEEKVLAERRRLAELY